MKFHRTALTIVLVVAGAIITLGLGWVLVAELSRQAAVALVVTLYLVGRFIEITHFPERSLLKKLGTVIENHFLSMFKK